MKTYTDKERQNHVAAWKQQFYFYKMYARKEAWDGEY